jgi:Protein of unknown function (DUF3224)
MRVTGKFDVTLKPQSSDDIGDGAPLARMAIDKRYHGELEASGKGEMLTALTPLKGSAGYVAMERISGSLQGRKGSFVIQPSATMTRGVPSLSVTVVPDSGTGELAGIAGKMSIVVGDYHAYDLEFTLP